MSERGITLSSSLRPEPPKPDGWPAEPQAAGDTGLDFGLLLDLCLKTIYYAGRPSARLLCQRMALAFGIVDELLTFLRKQEYVEAVGSAGVSEFDFQYALTNKGVSKTQEALETTQYVGPAPVPFDLYVKQTKRQSVRQMDISPANVEAALGHLVLDPSTVERVGTAFAAGKSIFLYGEPGNGKSTIAAATADMLPGEILVPYAFEIYGQIVRVFDSRVHQPVAAAESDDGADDLQADSSPRLFAARRRPDDKRWCFARRPLVVAGSELTLAELELRFSPISKFYVAPLQLKASNGVLVVDDFGRQRLRPEELLNRWLMPMDRHIDHLALETGETFDLPFDVVLVFSTNIAPSRLGDEAFFRRIDHKIRISDPDEAAFRRIIAGVAAQHGIAYRHDVADHLIESYYRRAGRPFRGVHPRDIFTLLIDTSHYQGRTPQFTVGQVDRVCASYFVQD